MCTRKAYTLIELLITIILVVILLTCSGILVGLIYFISPFFWH